ncbi:MAG: hypothetical protein KAT34_11545, partial [Candidatus Aminicenantes bacterium]|nr:hypothetical protein [Candidatus Aminicenantes bacterium]
TFPLKAYYPMPMLTAYEINVNFRLSRVSRLTIRVASYGVRDAEIWTIDYLLFLIVNEKANE